MFDPQNEKMAFAVDAARCTACGKCAEDCPAGIIGIEDELPRVAPEDREDCLGCQHCLAVCPAAAARVAGRHPQNSLKTGGPAPEELDLLVRSRRSVRHWAPGNVDPALLDRVLAGTAHAPTGVNVRSRRFAVIRDAGLMHEFRDRATALLAAARLPDDVAWLAGAAAKWREKGRDVIFRNAPHIIVSTSGPGQATPGADGVLALAYFELLAQANGIGTVWCGMAEKMLRHVPGTRALLGIPEDHSVGYAMLFGMPGVVYPRTVQYGMEEFAVLEKLGTKEKEMV